MSKANKPITILATEEEREILREYCRLKGKGQSDIIRAYIRRLQQRLKK